MLQTGQALTQHGLGDRNGDRGTTSHSPAGRKVGDFCAQHLHDHMVVQCKVKLMVIDKLDTKNEKRLFIK